VSAVAALPALARRGRPSFRGALRSELMKIGRQRALWVMTAGFAAVTAIVFTVFAVSGDPHRMFTSDPARFFFTYLTALQQVFSTVAGAILLITAARLVSMEYGSGTIRLVLARGTGRLTLLGAQCAALAITGLVLVAGFALAGAVFLGALALAWHGNLDPLTGLPHTLWTDTGWMALVALVSIAVCVLLGTAAAVVGRSVAFAVGVAVAFFPADNFGVIVLALLTRITHQQGWAQATQYLLGPNLNHLLATLVTDRTVQVAFAEPLVAVSAAHCWAVIGAYSLVFLAAAVVLTWRRDIVH
jgi:ABC-type transport system involved in multi-copper enzyme maturation permease subunit